MYIFKPFGALANSSQFDAVVKVLKDKFDIYCPRFPGHGLNDGFTGDILVADLTAFVLDYIEKKRLTKPHFLGYSLGGYVALNLASQHSDKVGRIYSLATHFYWTDDFAAKAVSQLNADKMLEKVPGFAAQLQRTFGEAYWRVLLDKTAVMMTQLGGQDNLAAQLANIQNPVIIAVGQLDKLVDVERSKKAADALPNGQFKLLDGTKHLFEQLEPSLIQSQLEQFLL